MQVILDLDNTCLFSLPSDEVKNKKWYKNFITVDMDESFKVFKRPKLEEFLDWLFKNFTVSVWSSGSESYVKWIVDNIIEKNNRKLRHVLNLKDCKKSQKKYGSRHIKNLKLLWDVYDFSDFGPYNTILIDDLEDCYRNNPRNALPIKEFISGKKTINDNELIKIKEKLIKIKKHYKKHINDKEFFLLEHFPQL